MPPNEVPNSARKRLACRQCQRRKIRCDRNSPCLQCEEAGMTCEQSSRKKRAKPRMGIKREDDLRNRLASLESLVHKLSGDDSQPHAAEHVLPSADKYLASHFWHSLATEFHALREALESDEEGSDQESGESPFGSSAPLLDETDGNFEFILCGPGNILVLPDAIYEPDPAMALDLYELHSDRIDRSWKRYHTPSLRAFTDRGESYLGRHAQAPCNQALKATILFSAIGQITDAECEQRYGQQRSVLLDRFRRLAEMKLIQADPMNTTALATLQALVQYVAALRKIDASRRSWSIFALVVRLARAFKLHTEGRNETFFLAELRRRLWHNIVIMDAFFALDRGSEALIGVGSFSRPLPSNLNDGDFDENTVSGASIVPRQEEFTDMTFALVVAELSACVHRINFLEDKPVGETWQHRLQVAENMRKSLQDKYLQYCDWNKDFQRNTLRVAGVVLSGLTLRAVRPMQRDPSHTLPPIDSPWVFEIALDVLRQSQAIGDDRPLHKYKQLKWVQWHPISVVLAGLCSIKTLDKSTEDEAFKLAEAMMAYSEPFVADSKSGSLWQPVEKLYKMAKRRCHRDEHNTTTLDRGEQQPMNGDAGLEDKIFTSTFETMDLSAQNYPLDSRRMWSYVSNPGNSDMAGVPVGEDVDPWLDWDTIIADIDAVGTNVLWD